MENFEQWKQELLDDFEVTIRGHEDEEIYEKISNRFLEKIHALNFSANEAEADVLFLLFTDEEDGEVLESVVCQLEGMKDKDLLTKCMLKAFPRLIEKARTWAEYFIYRIVELYSSSILPLILNSADKNGKQAIIDFIKKLNSTSPPESYFKSERLMQSHLKDLARFNELAKGIEKSMA
jgi:uncharacterized membrane-anchored protein YjiN (DUF445 family)